jgi:prepilin-type N-terminal cleavage/methylation domain-containing protein
MKSQFERPVRGNTLIESMVALVVFSIGILGIMQLNVMASGQNGLAKRQTNAARITRDLIDSFERIPYNHPALAVSGMDFRTNTDFLNHQVTTGMRRLSDAVGANDMPILGSTAAVLATEPQAYDVWWRVSSYNDAAGVEQGKVIAVVVRVSMPGGSKRDIVSWTVKYDPNKVTTTGQEI